jgi:hypothetical protein
LFFSEPSYLKFSFRFKCRAFEICPFLEFSALEKGLSLFSKRTKREISRFFEFRPKISRLQEYGMREIDFSIKFNTSEISFFYEPGTLEVSFLKENTIREICLSMECGTLKKYII